MLLHSHGDVWSIGSFEYYSVTSECVAVMELNRVSWEMLRSDEECWNPGLKKIWFSSLLVKKKKKEVYINVMELLYHHGNVVAFFSNMCIFLVLLAFKGSVDSTAPA